MKFSKSIVLILVSISFNSYAQENALENSNQIKFAPFRLIDTANPGIEFAFEKRFTKNIAAQVVGTYLTEIKIPFIGRTERKPWKNVKNYSGYRFSGELKYYFFKKHIAGLYVSIEYVYLQSHFNDILTLEDTVIQEPYQKINYEDSVYIFKNTQSFNLKFGARIEFKRFVLDPFFGWGLKYRIVKHFDRRNSDDDFAFISEDYGVHNSATSKGDYYTLSLSLGIRVGYSF